MLKVDDIERFGDLKAFMLVDLKAGLQDVLPIDDWRWHVLWILTETFAFSRRGYGFERLGDMIRAMPDALTFYKPDKSDFDVYPAGWTLCKSS